MKVDLGDGGDLVSVTIDKERAEPGQYTIEINELAARTSVITNGFENADQPIFGMGFVTLNPKNGSAVTVYVDEKNSSLRGIASAINRTPESPVRASVIRDVSGDGDDSWKLILAAKADGAEAQVDIPEFYFDGEDIFIEDNKDSKNAELVLDGFPIETPSNDLPDFIQGVNLHLKAARPEKPFTLTISEDNKKMTGKIKDLVDNINQILQFITKQNTVDQTTDTTNTFAGDGSLQTLEYQLRNVIHDGIDISEMFPDKPVLFLNEIGIEFDKTGQLTFKEEKFNNGIEKEFDRVAEALTGAGGFVNRIRSFFDGYTRSGNGLLQIKEKGIHSRIDNIDDQIEQKTRYLDRRRQNLVEKFSRLEASLGNLQRQQQYLSAALPSGGGGNILSQLLGG